MKFLDFLMGSNRLNMVVVYWKYWMHLGLLDAWWQEPKWNFTKGKKWSFAAMPSSSTWLVRSMDCNQLQPMSTPRWPSPSAPTWPLTTIIIINAFNCQFRSISQQTGKMAIHLVKSDYHLDTSNSCPYYHIYQLVVRYDPTVDNWSFGAMHNNW